MSGEQPVNLAPASAARRRTVTAGAVAKSTRDKSRTTDRLRRSSRESSASRTETHSPTIRPSKRRHGARGSSSRRVIRNIGVPLEQWSCRRRAGAHRGERGRSSVVRRLRHFVAPIFRGRTLVRGRPYLTVVPQDPELLHPTAEGVRMKPEDHCRSLGTLHDPTRGVEYGSDVLALHLFEGARITSSSSRGRGCLR